jgi:hypothetical protein
VNFDEMERRNVATMGEALGKQYTVMFHEVGCAPPLLERISRIVWDER